MNTSNDKLARLLMRRPGQRGNFKRETESLLIKTRTILLGPIKEKTINHIINECSKLAQKEYKSRHEEAGKVIH